MVHNNSTIFFFLFQKDEVKKLDEYRCIVPLRVLLSQRHNPERYKLTDYLMDHNENRMNYEDVWQAQKTFVNEYLRQWCNSCA